MEKTINFDQSFDGVTFIPEFDQERLGRQMRVVYNLMFDEKWRTLQEISQITGEPESSISARLRDLRKERFGSHNIERRRRGEEKRGLHEYRMFEKD